MEGLTLKELADKYIRDNIIRPATARNYLTIAHIASRDIGDIPANKLSRDKLIQWRLVVVHRASETTWNTYARHLKALLNYARKTGIVNKHSIDKSIFIPTRNKKKKTVEISTIRKAHRLLEQLDTPLQPGWFWSIALSTLYYTAMRRSQITALQWRDIDMKRGIIHYREVGSKTHSEWEIPVATPLTGELERLLNRTIKVTGLQPAYLQTHQVFNVTLFSKRYKGTEITPDQVSQFFRRLSNHLGERISAHMVRHTCSTALTNIRREMGTGTGLKVAQKILGHSSITTTAVYVHPDMQQMRVALEALPKI